ncbi:DUF4192 domain-containing protein, partial [Streptomyces boncukensis]
MTQHSSESGGTEPDSPHARFPHVYDGDGSRHHGDPGTGSGPAPECRGPVDVSLRSPAELADALPYLLGFYPDDSIVAVSLHGQRGRFGGRFRIGIPESPDDWPAMASQVAECLDVSATSHGTRPDGVLIFLCQDPGPDSTGREVKDRLQPLAQRIRLACGELEMPVYEALCISDGRYFSYCCPDTRCCVPEGNPLAQPGTSAMAAAAAYAGLRVHGSLREMEQRLAALGPPLAHKQEKALDSVGAALVPRMLTQEGRLTVRGETLALAGRLMSRFHQTPPQGSSSPMAQDAQDDGLLSHKEAASMILGLQDRRTRDQAAEWMEGLDIGPALRLWRALARRCVGPYGAHSAAPLTLAGWVAWSGEDGPTARVALSMALRADPDYVFAQLLQQACNEGLDPELLRRCMRRGRETGDHPSREHPDQTPHPAETDEESGDPGPA